MKRRLLTPLFSKRLGLFLTVGLLLFFAWLLVYLPSIGEANRIDAIMAEFKAHGCRSLHAETVSVFENHRFLKHLELEKKVLRELNFGSGSEVPRSFLTRPPRLPDLEIIRLLDSDLDDAGFSWAVRIPSVKEVNIGGDHRISEKGFRSLNDRTEPLALVLQVNNQIEQDLNSLGFLNSPNLNDLTIINCELNESCFRSLGRMTSLKNLSLYGCTGLSGIVEIRNLPLVSLAFSSGAEEIDDEILETPAQMPELVELSLPSQSRISVRGYDVLKSSPKLLRVYGIPPERKDEFDEFFRLRLESLP